MSAKFVPYEKLSKMNKKKLNRKKRKFWDSINPVSRVIPDKRRKLRDKANKEDADI